MSTLPPPKNPRIPKVGLYSNPFAAYAIGFTVALMLYSLKLSDLYPDLSTELVFFLLTTILLCILLAYKTSNIEYKYDLTVQKRKKNLLIFLSINTLFFIDIMYSGAIPLISTLLGGYNYREFGAPVVHVAYVGLNSFYMAFWFDTYMKGKQTFFLKLSLLSLSSHLLTMNRGAFTLSLVAILFIYFSYNKISSKGAIKTTILGLLFIWIFGWFGEIRSSASTTYQGENNIIGKIGQSNQKFDALNLPKEFFWSYIYISSPLANFQNTINHYQYKSNFAEFVAMELAPDFISKRLYPDADKATGSLITQELTVSTAFSKAFKLQGWLGSCIVFLYLIFLTITCVYTLKNTKYFITALSLLSSASLLLVFSNMLVFTGAILPFYIALLLGVCSRFRITKR